MMQKLPRNPIKFDKDFDFEQANNKFEELRSQLSKLKVGDEPKSTEQVSFFISLLFIFNNFRFLFISNNNCCIVFV